MKYYNPPKYMCVGKMVCEANVWNPVSKAKYWYTYILVGEGDTVLQMKQFLMTNTAVIDISKKK